MLKVKGEMPEQDSFEPYKKGESSREESSSEGVAVQKQLLDQTTVSTIMTLLTRG